MAGLDIPSKLRRALGGPKNITPEQISAKLAAFDKDGDGALTREELAQAFMAFGCGGAWFCNIMARGVWSFCEMVVPPPVTWIKISLLGPSIHGFMQLQPRKAKRVAITPAGAYGWEPLMYTDGTPVDPNNTTVLPELPSIYGDLPAALGNQSRRAPTAGEPLSRPPPMPPSSAGYAGGAPLAAPGSGGPGPLPTPPGGAGASSAAGASAPSSPGSGPSPRVSPSAAPRAPLAAAGRAPTAVPGRAPAGAAAPARPAPSPLPRRPGPRR